MARPLRLHALGAPALALILAAAGSVGLPPDAPAAAPAAAAQDTVPPARPDTLPPDVRDTISPAVQDTATRTADADTVRPPEVFPAFPLPAAFGPATARSWSLHDLLLNGALTPADLIEEALVPLDPVRAGFLEGPQAFVFAGGGPAGFRASIDGYELAPLGGGTFDMHTLSMVELGRMRLVREPGGYGLWAQAHRRDRPDPYSRIEGGTGDRDTNMLRALFSAGFMGSPIVFGFDRVDTDGAVEIGGGERSAVRVSVARSLPLELWAQLEYRSTTVERDTTASPGRTDWVLRLRRSFGDRWHADLVAGRGRRVEEREVPIEDPDAPPEEPVREVAFTARQLALRGAHVSERLRGFLTLRLWDGEGVPNFDPAATLDARWGPLAVSASGRYTDWGDHDALAGYGAVRLGLPFGLRATAELDAGERGLYGDTTAAEISFERWTAGGGIRQLGWQVDVRAGVWETEPSPGLRPPFDSLTSLAGGRAGVFEASATGRALRLWGGEVIVAGRYRAREIGPFLYWPQDEWWVEGRYHAVLYGGQLEIDLRGLGGVRGPMRVVDRSAGVDAVVLTEDQTRIWGEARVRVRDVYIYYTYEVFEATGGPFDVPGFPLPRARTHFGLKWEFWN